MLHLENYSKTWPQRQRLQCYYKTLSIIFWLCYECISVGYNRHTQNNKQFSVYRKLFEDFFSEGLRQIELHVLFALVLFLYFFKTFFFPSLNKKVRLLAARKLQLTHLQLTCKLSFVMQLLKSSSNSFTSSSEGSSAKVNVPSSSIEWMESFR